MWNEQKRERFQTLRQRELDCALTKTERKELARMIEEIESAEASTLHLATEQLHRRRERIEAQNCDLQALVHRKEAFVARLHSLLEELEAERRTINEELDRILGGKTPVEAGVSR
jgi:hypothetical protein